MVDRQYGKVSRAGNFSFDIYTFIIIIRCITLVICPSIFPSRPALVYSTPWNSHVCGPTPSSTSGSSLRGVVTRFFVYSSNYSFLGARRFQHKARHPPQELPYFSGNLRPAPPPHRRWQARSRLLPDQASHDYNLNFKLRSPAHPLEFRRSSLALAWLLLAAPVNTAQLALFSTTAVSVSLMFPGPENLHYSNLLY